MGRAKDTSEEIELGSRTRAAISRKAAVRAMSESSSRVLGIESPTSAILRDGDAHARRLPARRLRGGSPRGASRAAEADRRCLGRVVICSHSSTESCGESSCSASHAHVRRRRTERRARGDHEDIVRQAIPRVDRHDQSRALLPPALRGSPPNRGIPAVERDPFPDVAEGPAGQCGPPRGFLSIPSGERSVVTLDFFLEAPAAPFPQPGSPGPFPRLRCGCLRPTAGRTLEPANAPPYEILVLGISYLSSDRTIIPSPLHQPSLPERDAPFPPHDDVVEQAQPDGLRRRGEAARELPVLPRGRRIARRMVVVQDHAPPRWRAGPASGFRAARRRRGRACRGRSRGRPAGGGCARSDTARRFAPACRRPARTPQVVLDERRLVQEVAAREGLRGQPPPDLERRLDDRSRGPS